jgi:hypothetical protein
MALAFGVSLKVDLKLKLDYTAVCCRLYEWGFRLKRSSFVDELIRKQASTMVIYICTIISALNSWLRIQNECIPWLKNLGSMTRPRELSLPSSNQAPTQFKFTHRHGERANETVACRQGSQDQLKPGVEEIIPSVP